MMLLRRTGGKGLSLGCLKTGKKTGEHKIILLGELNSYGFKNVLGAREYLWGYLKLGRYCGETREINFCITGELNFVLLGELKIS